MAMLIVCPVGSASSVGVGKALVQCLKLWKLVRVMLTIKESVTETSEAVDVTVRGILARPGVSREAGRIAQIADPCFRWLIELKESGSSRPHWDEVSHTSRTHKTMWSKREQLEVHERLLSRRWESDDGRLIRWQLVLPEKDRKDVVNELHGGTAGGHLGLRKTLAKVKWRYFWPGMTADVRSPAKRTVAAVQRGCPC